MTEKYVCSDCNHVLDEVNDQDRCSNCGATLEEDQSLTPGENTDTKKYEGIGRLTFVIGLLCADLLNHI